jgi:pimeloyl-ACP methyl ester carboxylesterase
MVRLNARGFRTIAYDRRGHGRSTDPGVYDYDVLSDDLGEVLERLDLNNTVVVTHSGAAGEIIRYLSRHRSKRVARAVLVGAMGPRMISTAPGEPGLPAELVEVVIDEISTDLAEWIDKNIQPFAPGLDAVTRRWLAATPLDASRRALVDFQRAIMSADLIDEARELTVPVTLIHGDADASAPLELTAQRYADVIPDSRLLIYEGAAHGIMLTHAERLASDIAG